MRIDDLNRTPLSQGSEKTQGTEKTSPSGSSRLSDLSGLAPTADQADVSALAQSLSRTDSSRIEQLRLAVESGTYSVSANAVAASLIQAHLKE